MMMYLCLNARMRSMHRMNVSLFVTKLPYSSLPSCFFSMTTKLGISRTV